MTANCRQVAEKKRLAELKAEKDAEDDLLQWQQEFGIDKKQQELQRKKKEVSLFKILLDMFKEALRRKDEEDRLQKEQEEKHRLEEQKRLQLEEQQKKEEEDKKKKEEQEKR